MVSGFELLWYLIYLSCRVVPQPVNDTNAEAWPKCQNDIPICHSQTLYMAESPFVRLIVSRRCM